MPTFNQLVRKGRQTSEKKSTAPALQKGWNSLQKRATDVSAPQKRGVCTGEFKLMADAARAQRAISDYQVREGVLAAPK